MIKIEKLTNGFKVEGIDNVLYPDNGTLVFGANTVILVTDESNIATFRSASNFDVLFSGLIENITIGGESVTKDNIVEKFQAIANAGQGSQEDVSHRLEQIEGEVALKANSADLLTLFDSAEYNSQTKKIVFKHGDTVLVQIDATDFIKDGMVSNVEIVNDKLVISFNTDAGKQNIEITLSDIFNPNNYYTKEQIDTKEQNINASIALKLDKETFDVKEEVISKALNDLHDSIPTVPTNVSAFTNDAGYLTQNDIANKQDKLTAGENITIENNVISSTGGTQVQADWNQTNVEAVDYIKNKPTIPDTSEFVTKTEYNPKEKAIAEALTNLNENKADKTELPDVSTFATKTELNAKQDALVSGTNIKTINNQSILGEGNIEIQGGAGEQQQADWNQTETTAVDYIKNKPTNVSAFANDAGYLTQHQSLADYYTKSEIDAMVGNINTILASI